MIKIIAKVNNNYHAMFSFLGLSSTGKTAPPQKSVSQQEQVAEMKTYETFSIIVDELQNAEGDAKEELIYLLEDMVFETELYAQSFLSKLENIKAHIVSMITVDDGCSEGPYDNLLILCVRKTKMLPGGDCLHENFLYNLFGTFIFHYAELLLTRKISCVPEKTEMFEVFVRTQSSVVKSIFEHIRLADLLPDCFIDLKNILREKDHEVGVQDTLPTIPNGTVFMDGDGRRITIIESSGCHVQVLTIEGFGAYICEYKVVETPTPDGFLYSLEVYKNNGILCTFEIDT